MPSLRIAEAFHDEYEAQAAAHGWVTQDATRVVFDELHEGNRSLMLGVVARLLHRGVIVPFRLKRRSRHVLRDSGRPRDRRGSRPTVTAGLSGPLVYLRNRLAAR